MSKDPRPYAEVLPIAQELERKLLESGACQRTLIAGSLRRQKPVVGDIELVVMPVFTQLVDPMFGMPTGKAVSELDVRLAGWGVVLRSNGPKFKQFDWNGMPVDLFVQLDTSTWGMNATLRTGSAAFSEWLMTMLKRRGYTMSEARVWKDGTPLETETELDMFRLAGIEWVEPAQRTQEWVDTIGRRLLR